MNIWIDDEKNPKDHLTVEECEKTIWFKEIRPAVNFIIDSKENVNIEKIYVDHWLNEPYLTGEFILEELFFGLEGKHFVLPKLTEVCLISNDRSMVEEMKEKFAEYAQSANVSLFDFDLTKKTETKKLWIDDLRDPQRFLKNQPLENVIWISKIRDALDVVLYNDDGIEFDEIFLDHYMDEDHLTGTTLLNDLFYALKTECIQRPYLKTIQLHSSENTIVKKALEKYQDGFKELGIELKKAKYV